MRSLWARFQFLFLLQYIWNEPKEVKCQKHELLLAKIFILACLRLISVPFGVHNFKVAVIVYVVIMIHITKS